ncbi:MAG: hypothetical protein ACWA5P_13930 [bacterium]
MKDLISIFSEYAISKKQALSITGGIIAGGGNASCPTCGKDNVICKAGKCGDSKACPPDSVSQVYMPCVSIVGGGTSEM